MASSWGPTPSTSTPYFQRCFDDGRFEIDNGRTARWIRPVAFARRMFLFTGSMHGGQRLATAFTLVDSCLILRFDSYPYLVDVVNKIERGWPLRQLSQLIPHRWTREQAGQNRAEQAWLSAVRRCSPQRFALHR